MTIRNQVKRTGGKTQVVVELGAKGLAAGLREITAIIGNVGAVFARKEFTGRDPMFGFVFMRGSGKPLDEPAFFAACAKDAKLHPSIVAYVKSVIAANKRREETLYIHEELEAGGSAIEALVRAKAKGVLGLLLAYLRSIDLDHTVHIYELMDFVRESYAARELQTIEAYLRDQGVGGGPEPKPEAKPKESSKIARWTPAFCFEQPNARDDEDKEHLFRALSVDGTRAWLCGSKDGLFCFDLAKPSAPRPLAKGSKYPAYNGWCGRSIVAVAGHVYAPPITQAECRAFGLRVSHLAGNKIVSREVRYPFEVGSSLAAGTDYLAGTLGGYWDTNQVGLFELNDPGQPEHVGTFVLLDSKDVAVAGRTLYVVTKTQLVVVDVTDLRTPRELARLKNPLRNELSDVRVLGDILVANSQWIVDIAKPAAPRTIQTLKEGTKDVVRDGDRLIVFEYNGSYRTITLGARKKPLASVAAQLVDDDGEELLFTINRAELIGDVLLTITPTEFRTFVRTP